MNNLSKLHMTILQAAWLIAALAAGITLTGCGYSNTAVSSAPVTVSGGSIQGNALGGQQPIANATVQLWAAGNSGYGSASTPLITGISATTSNGSGSGGNASNANNSLKAGYFSISGDFTCPTPSTTPVYLTITGGNPVGTATNANLGLMAALGPCNGISSSTFVNVNEISTVASVWALSPFMSAYDHVGTSTTNALGLANAFASVNKLVNVSTGLPSGPMLPAGATLPVQEIYALGNILASCVNSTGGVASDTSTNCGKLFSYTAVGTTPGNTIDAAMHMAQYPTNNIAGLFALVSATGAAYATTATQPTSWTIAINYTGGGLNHPEGIAVDAGGNIWVPNAGTSQATSNVTLLYPTGATQAGGNGIQSAHINQPSAVALDAGGHAWITNNGDSSIAEIGAGGSSISSYSGNGLSSPSGLAFDPSGNIWVSNGGTNSVSAFTSSGSAVGTYSNIGSITTPVGIVANPQ